MKCHVHISPCGVIGPSHCDRLGSTQPKVAIRMPVNRLTTNAIAVDQCRMMVPTSLRGGRLRLSDIEARLASEAFRDAAEVARMSRGRTSLLAAFLFAGGGDIAGAAALAAGRALS